MSKGKGIRIPMFVKFLVGCLALATLLIVGGTPNPNQARHCGKLPTA